MNKKITFKRSLLLLISVFVTIGVIFAATQIFASKNECVDCDDKDVLLNNGKGFTNNELKKMREKIKNSDKNYTIGNNSATKYQLNEICGLNKKTKVQVSAPTDTIKEDTKLQSSLPTSFDLRDKGLTSIKNQDTCGSCWAFTTAGVFENVIKLNTNVELDLSEQWLINCNDDGYGCNGGWWEFEMYEDTGAVYESDMPYTNNGGNCKTNLKYHEKIEGWSYIGKASSTPSDEQIKEAIYNYGPVAVGVYADYSFQAYTGGTFNTTNGTVNHGVILVGWDDSKGTWILRNSWGSGWGESGYMYIEYGANNIGEGAAYVTYDTDNTSNNNNKSVNPTSETTTKPTTTKPTSEPTIKPTIKPTSEPTDEQTTKPTIYPTDNSSNPTKKPIPTVDPDNSEDTHPTYDPDDENNNSYFFSHWFDHFFKYFLKVFKTVYSI